MWRFHRIQVIFFLIAGLVSPVQGAMSAPRWEKGPDAPTARTEVAAAVLNGKIYVIGGFTRLLGASRMVEMFDPKSQTWETRAKLPVALHHTSAVAFNGRIYVLGGFKGRFSWTPSEQVFAYDPETDQWSAKRDMPTARGALGAGISGGRIFAVGGLGRSRDGLVNTGANEVYDPASDRWEVKAPLPTPRDHLAVAAVNGRIHAVGGRLGSNYAQNLADHHQYDPDKNTWVLLKPLPRARSGTAAAVLKGRLHVFGGEGPKGTFSDHDVYDPETGRWATAPPLPTARHGLGAAVIGNRIYVLSGGPKPGGSYSGANEIFLAD